MNTEHSKILTWIVSAVIVVVTAFTLFMVYITQDLSPLDKLIEMTFGAFAVVLAFYFNKAKAENRIKLRKKYGAEIFNDAKEGEETDEPYC